MELTPTRLLWKLQCNILAKNGPEVHHIDYQQSVFTIIIYGYIHFQFTLFSACVCFMKSVKITQTPVTLPYLKMATLPKENSQNF